MKQIIAVLFLCVMTGINASDMDVYRKRINDISLAGQVVDAKLVEEIIRQTDSGKYIDNSVKENYLKILLPEKEVRDFIKAQYANGAWPDIDYKGKNRSGWEPSYHVNRLFHLTKSYYSPFSPLNKSPELFRTISKGLDYWFDAKLVCPNWWYNEIGINMILGQTLLLLKDELSPEQIQKGVEVLSLSKIRMTGQNKVWLSGNVAYRAVLQNDPALLAQAGKSIGEEIFITVREGIQPDFSFHQHGPQLQFGNYGLSYALSLAYWANVFAGTDLSLPAEKISVLRRYILDGLNQAVWRGYMDFNACGRQLFKNAQRGKAMSLARALMDMQPVDSDFSNAYYTAWQSIMLQENSTPRNVCFYRSDILSHKGNGWYVSVKMSSPRVIGTEAGNGENLRGYYLADGVTALMKQGDEYENIFPLWDWRKLPGATIPQSDEPLPVLSWDGYRNGSDFAGGVSDGKTGLAAFCLQRDGVSAKKAYFLFPDKMVCLGGNLASTTGKPLLTTINQTRKKGDIHLLKDNRKWQVTEHAEWTLKTPATFFHAGFGYHVDDAEEVTVSAKNHQGNWRTVVDHYEDTPLEAPVFMAFLKDRQGKYAYSVFPAETQDDVAKSLQDNSYLILRNDSACQAVWDKKENIIQAAFYFPDKLLLPGKTSLRTEQASLFICKQTAAGWQIHVADPTQQLKKITFSLSDKTFHADLPSGEQAGSTVVVNTKQ